VRVARSSLEGLGTGMEVVHVEDLRVALRGVVGVIAYKAMIA
jgi:hypothetical protein